MRKPIMIFKRLVTRKRIQTISFSLLLTTASLVQGSTIMPSSPINTRILSSSKPTDPRLKEFPTLTIIDHPLVQHKLTMARDQQTSTHSFRSLLTEIALLIGYEITKNLKTQNVSIVTPVSPTTGQRLPDKGIVIVPVLRAGLSMAEGLHDLIPTADIAHIGLSRDPETKKPKEYLFKIPPVKDQIFIVVDPMLATGGSATYAVQKLISAGVPVHNILFMALVVAPEGMRVFQEAFPSIPVFAASLDERLNEHAYIVPGLGDAGDRLYGTD